MSLGPPDVSSLLLKGIGGLGTMFQQGFDGAQKRAREQERRGLLSEIGPMLSRDDADFRGAAAKALALGDADLGIGLLKLGETAAERRATQEALRNSPFFGGQQQGGGSGAAPNVSVSGDSNIRERFISGARQAGLTNSYGLAAIAATGQRESGFSPGNQNRTWSDPSESGQAGTSGGLMSWRGPRLQALQNFARQNGEQGLGSPETQARFMAQEDPTLIPRLNAARSPQEANQIMANAWRFAGFNRQGGELSAREALTARYAQQFKGGQPVQMAQDAPMPPRRPPGIGGVQVAMNEEQTQALEAQMEREASQPVQMAQAGASDVPASGAEPAQFAAPGAPQPRGGAMPPNDPRPHITDDQLMGVLTNPRLQAQHGIAKQLLDNRMRWRAEGGQLREQNQRLQNQKLQRDLDNRFEPLVTPEQRRAAGIPDNDPRPYQINRATNEIKAVGGNQVTVNNQQEREFDKKTGGAIAERFSKLVEDGDQATTDYQTLGDLRALGQRIQTGGGAAIQGWLAERGIKIGDNVGSIEAYGALIDRLTPQQRAPGSGATSDFDAKMFKASLPRLINTPEGNELIVGTLERLADNRIKRAEIAQRVQIGELTVKDGVAALRGLQQEARQMSVDLRERAFRGAAQQGGQQSGPPAVPQPGAVMDGWRFRGGDPSNRNSWERAQ